ncbi:hypothetical protein D3C81_1876920 [compost metagenome]
MNHSRWHDDHIVYGYSNARRVDVRVRHWWCNLVRHRALDAGGQPARRVGFDQQVADTAADGRFDAAALGLGGDHNERHVHMARTGANHLQ